MAQSRRGAPGNRRATLSLTLALLAAPGSAQDLNLTGLGGFGGEDAGVPVLGFLKLPASARGVGMGGASRTTDEEASLVRTNPALLALVGDNYYAVSHTEVLGEFRHENLAFTCPTARWGNFGGSANILAATAFEDARDIDENRSRPEAYDLALGLSYGKSLWRDQVNAGARLDLIRSELDGASANGYALSAAALFLLAADWRLAVTVDNLSHGIRYDDHNGSPFEPLPLSVGAEAGKPLLGDRWSAQAGAVQGNDGITHFYGGAEWLLLRHLAVRGGYDGSVQERSLGPWSGFSAGLGIKYDKLTLDYGFRALGPLGDYHSFSLSYSSKTAFRERDEIYLARAREKFRAGDYRKALSLARAAIAVNPYNIKAQALAQKASLELDRLDEMAVTLAYTGNTRGRLAPEWRDGKPLGGLARRKSKLLEMKGAGGKILILDAGDLTRPGASLDKADYVYGAYAQMPYDAINVGAAEARLGADRLDPRLPFLASQKPLEGMRPLLAEKVLKLKRGNEVLVLGAVSPSGARAGTLGGKELEAVAAAVRRRTGGEKPHRITVLLLRATLAEARAVAAQAPGLDAILLSGEAMPLAAPMKAGRTLLCSPGMDGTHVGELTLRLDKHGRVLSYLHHLAPLDASIPEDPGLRKFLEPVTVDPNRIALDDADDDYRSQVLAYIRAEAPGKGGRLVLKDLRSGKDYDVPLGGLACAYPVLGYGKNRAAFAADDGSGAREIYSYEPGPGRLDTLTRLGGRAGELRWFLRNNALLAVYARDGRSELYRIDPWSREARDLTRARFGTVIGFDLSRSGDRLALSGIDGQGATVWVTTPEFEAPAAIAHERGLLGSPRWSPDGNRLAWLSVDSAAAPGSGADSASGAGGAEAGERAARGPAGELRVFDFGTKVLVNATTRSRVRSFAWSADGKRVFYSAGVNLADLNAFSPDSMSLAKVTRPPASPRSEENPAPRMMDGRDGLLFESADGEGRKILWLDLETREERVIADSAGFNSLR